MFKRRVHPLRRLPRQHVYLTGRSLRARWQRFLFTLAYMRPVTYGRLRRIAGRAAGDLRALDPALDAFFNKVIEEAERPVWAICSGAPKEERRG